MSDCDCWIDATQSYYTEPTENTTSIEIVAAPNNDLLAIPTTSDANSLIRLVNNPANGVNNLYILQANPNGEIRFLTAGASANNDVGASQPYNVKIDSNGKLYLYHTYNVLTNPIYFSGWKDIMNDVAEGFRDINLLELGLAVIEGQQVISAGNISTLFTQTGILTTAVNLHTTQIAEIQGIVGGINANIAAIDGRLIFVEGTSTAYSTLFDNLFHMTSPPSGIKGWKVRGPVKDAFKKLQDSYKFIPTSAVSTQAVQQAGQAIENVAVRLNVAGTIIAPAVQHAGSAGQIAVVAGRKALEGIGLALVGASVAGGAIILYNYFDRDNDTADASILPTLYDVRAGLYYDSLKTADDPTKLTLNPYQIHKNGLLINAGTNNGFTTAGLYEYSGNVSYPDTLISFKITTGLTAEIVNVATSGNKIWVVGDVISIPKSAIGGTSGNLQISVIQVYTDTQIIDLQIAEVEARISTRKRRMMRRDDIVSYNDIDTTKLTYLTDTQAYLDVADTGETLTYKKLTSRLNLLPTGGSDVDIYTNTGSLGIGTTPQTNIDTYHISDNILRLGSATAGQNSIEFKRGTDLDVYTDFRLIADTSGYFKLQYEDDAKAYGDTGTNIIWGSKDKIIFHKDTEITGNVGIGTSALTSLHTYGATANTLLLETGTAGTPIIEFRKGTTADTTTDWRFIADAGGIFKFQFNNNTTAFGATANASDIWNARTDRMIIYKNTTISLNCGIGGANPHATYKLNVGGDVNIPAGSLYRVGTNPLSYNDLADKLVSGTNINIVGNTINCVPPNTLAENIDGIIGVEHGGTGRNDIGLGAIPFGNGTETAYTWTADLRYDQALGRLGVGIMNPSYAIDVNGDVNIPLTSNYRIGGNPLSYNNLADKLIGGTNISITSGVIDANVPAQLTAGTGITIVGGAINATTQLTAGTNINITGGIISADVPTTFAAGAITSGTLALARGGTGTTTIGNGAIPYGNSLQNAYTWNNLFKFDEVNTRLGINKSTPIYTLDVGGDINIPTGTSYRINGTALTFTNLSGICDVSKGGTGLSVVATGAIIFGNISSSAYNWKTSFKYDETNNRLGVNKANPLYTIDTGGDINIPTGSVYRVGNNPLSYKNLADQLTAGTGITIVGSAINATTQLTAGTNINITSGVISANVPTTFDAGAITTGTFGVDRGGTGNASITSGNILYGNGTGAIANNTSFKYLSGRLGVNMVGTPFATLHIGTGATATSGAFYVWFDFNSGSTLGFTNFNRTDVCAYLQGSLWLAGGRFIASSSDIRIKQEIEDINDDSALQMILAVEPKTYKYIDKPTLGDKRVYGFIAQQIREVIPEAINLQKEIIPNILLLASYNDGIITLPSQPPSVVIKVGDKLRCYDKINKEIIAFVEEVINTLTFKIATLEEPYTDTRIFIYGTEIDDFHTIDKNYIYTLNVCATQELHRKIVLQDDRIKSLEEKVERLLNYLT